MKKLVRFVVASLLVSLSAMAQSQRVTGVVTESSGSPVIGATVILKGSTSTAAITDIDGRYSISVPANSVLEFSYVGMKKEEVNVGTRAEVNVIMQSDAITMDGVVVTAIGVNRVERSLGYSVSKVDADETVMKAEPDMLRSLEGKIPGVVIGSPSGAAGSATKVTIRGSSSFTGNNQPLYVVDGVPYSNLTVTTSNQGSGGGGAYGSGISTLDPNDIESMNVLKSAASAALYGSRAANGVVVITTKSGSQAARSQKGLEITFNNSYSIETIGALPIYQNKFGQGSEFINSASNGSWGPEFTEGAKSEYTTGNWGDMAKYYPEWAAQTYPELVGSDGKSYVPYKAFPNNVKDMFNTGGIYESSLSVQSNNDRGAFNSTISRMKQTGYIPNSDFERFSFAVGGNTKLDNGIRTGGNISFARTLQNGSLYGYNQSGDIAVSAMGRTFIIPRNWDLSNMPYETPDGANLLAQLSAQSNNPYWAWKYNTQHTESNRTVVNYRIGYDFTDWLKADYTIGYNDYRMERKEVINLGSRGLTGGRIRTDDYNNAELESTLLLTGKFELTDDIGLEAILGHNINQRTSTRKFITGTDIINKGIYAIDNTQGQTASEAYSRRSLWGIFADVTLNYKTWAFLTITGRNDHSSTLPKKHNSYFYPAVSGSFIFTDAFDIESNFLNFGKFRASWAKVGSDASPYYVNGTYNVGDPYQGNGTLYAPTEQYDEALKPEFTQEAEVGLDMSFWEGHFGFEVTFYDKNSTSMIASLSTAPSTGSSSAITNFGRINNRGVEIGINAVPVLAGGFKWDLFASFTRNRSEVKELAYGLDEVRVGSAFGNPASYAIVGQPYGVLKGTALARDENGNPLVDPNNGFYIDALNDKVLGDPAPKYKASLINNFSYKGVTLSVMVDYSHGGIVNSAYLSDLLGRGVTRDTEDRYGSRILPGLLGQTTEVDGKTMIVPMTDANGNTIPNYIAINESDVWFSAGGVSSFATNSADEILTYDASVFRLRELSVSWELPKKWLTKANIGISSVNVSFVGRNLWFHAPNVPKYSNYDPTANSYGDSNAQGYDYTGVPLAKRYGFNISLKF
jgi:TonB-linked SusC/RagA family outer membrane protein